MHIYVILTKDTKLSRGQVVDQMRQDDATKGKRRDKIK